MKNHVYALITAFLVCGCATNGHSTLLGMGLGAVSGATAGYALDSGPNARYMPQNVGIGTAVGAVVGAVAGFLTHQLCKPTPALANPAPAMPQHLTSNLASGVTQPLLTTPKVETRYVEDQVKGDTYVPGHMEYKIVEPSQWNP